MRVLVAEDEIKVRKFILEALKEGGMVADGVADGSELLTALQTTAYEVLILDRLLRGLDTLDLLQGIRSKFPDLKILILSALKEVENRVEGLSQGADDYLGKPFHVSELMARVRALGRREKSPSVQGIGQTLQYQDLKLDLEKQHAFRGEQKMGLTHKEFRLLALMIRHPGKIFSKSTLLDQVWDMNHFPESNVVEVTLANLRAKLEKTGPPLIFSRRGVGYWLGDEEP